MTHEERVAHAIETLRAKHNRASCDDDCPTLVVLEELLRLRREADERRRGRRASSS